MTRRLIDETKKYRFELISADSEIWEEIGGLERVSTTYVHRGFADVGVMGHNGIKEVRTLRAGQGLLVPRGYSVELSSKDGSKIYTVSSVVDRIPLLRIIDDGNGRRQVPLITHEYINNPKRVDKPWGHELWISWTNAHVMKQIGMFKGKKSSLQFHRQKLETNILEEGQADVIDGYALDPQAPEEEVVVAAKGIDFGPFTKRMNPGDFWTSKPGVVHRVISVTDYLAYEVSTPELDDVIRLQDDSGRSSGRIEEEHERGRQKR